MTDKPRVAICQPVRGSIPAEAHQSQVALFCASWDIICGFSFVNNTYLDKARNMCVEQARNLEATHLFWLDADMTVPNDIIHRLLAHDLEVVGGLYHQRKEPYHPVAWSLDQDVTPNAEGEKYQKVNFKLLKDLPDEGLVQVGGVGTGALLTRVDVFDRIGQPWFASTFQHEGDLYFVGEDVFFSYRLRDIGVPVWLDVDVACGHVTDYTVSRADWEAHKDLG